MSTNSVSVREAAQPQSPARTHCHALSFAQERIWFLNQAYPGPAYNMAGVVRLRGEIDIEVLRWSLNEIVRRHEVLRTSFIEMEGRPQQQVHDEVPVRFIAVDMTQNNAPKMIDQELRSEAQRVFRLDEPGLFRVRLLRLSNSEYILMIVLHHIIADAWSLGVLNKELKELYTSRLESRPSVLPTLDIQYVDYASWQRTLLDSGHFQAGLDYWKTQLAGVPPLLELPIDFPRPAEPDYRGATLEMALEPELSHKLQHLSRRGGVTVFMTLLAGLFTLLWRYTGRTDLIVGLPSAERAQLETEGLIGLFVNLLALRVELSANLSFRDLLQRVKQKLAEAQRYSFIPFERVVNEAAQERESAYLPLVQTVFSWHSESRTKVQLGGVEGIVEAVPTDTAKFDLSFELGQDDAGISGRIEYRTQLFSERTIQRLSNHYLTLLKSSVAYPDSPLSDLNLMGTEDEIRVQTWARGIDSHRTQGLEVLGLLGQFRSHVDRKPESLAIEWRGQNITYRELDQESTRLANRLHASGVAAGDVVAICLERSPRAVSAMLAALKTGAAYLALDASYPAERLHYILKDSGARALCTEEQLLEKCGGATNISLLVDQDQVLCESDIHWSPRRMRTSEDAAYVIYTSGSTGQPKGVQLTDGGLQNLCIWHRQTFSLTPHDRTTQLASLGFDASVWEIWPTLLTGATLCFVPEEVRSSPLALRDWLLKYRITVCFVPTPLAENAVSLEWPNPTALRVMLTGGDRLRHTPKQRLPFLLYNNYGPSECSVVATSGLVEPAIERSTVPSIGRPIHNVQSYVLDAQMCPVPPGIPGELYIGGKGVGLGYHRRPKMTAERFLPNPFGSTPGERLYRTGDLVSFLDDGQIRFLGRGDEQVKLRGFRIELSEIESVLEQLDGIQEAAVLLVGRETGHGKVERLVAFLVEESGCKIDHVELAEHASRSLPAYMVPTSYVFLERLPVTTNGKLNKTALLGRIPLAENENDRATLSPTEEIIANLWSSLLGAQPTSREDNFFALGGHSLLVTQLTLRLNEIFGCQLSLKTVFEFPLLGQLAAHIEEVSQRESHLPRRVITRIHRQPLMALSPAQERLWFLHQFTSSEAAYNIAGAVRLKGKLDVDALRWGMEEIVRRHEVLRTKFVETEGRPQQQIHEEVPLRFRETDLRANAVPERINRELQDESKHIFRLDEPGLFRVHLWRLGEHEHVLMIVMHHIIADGWSIGVLIRELQELYGARREQRAPRLPDLQLQYVDYASWQRKLVDSDHFRNGLDYWKRTLAGAPPLLELATDFPRPPGPDYRGGTVKLDFEPELSQKLQALSRQEEVTLYMTLLAGFLALLWRYTGRNDLIVGTDVANRSHLGSETLIGLFVNQIVLRVNVEQDLSFRSLIRQVRETALAGYSRQDIPFGALVDALRPPRNLSFNPLFQTIVIFQHSPIPNVEFSGIQMEPVELEIDSSVFDLSLAFTVRADGLVCASLRHSVLFKATTAQQMLSDLVIILRQAATMPELQLDRMKIGPAMTKISKPETTSVGTSARFSRLGQMRPTPIETASGNLVTVAPSPGESSLPITFRPNVSEVDASAWARTNRALILTELSKSGALLFTGFPISSLEDFRGLTCSICPELLEYGERSSPRTRIEEGVYTSTDHPPDLPILLHNEQSYTLNWPMKIWFFCSQPAPSGGRTPIADSRKILRRLSSATVAKFLDKQLMYVRNYGDGLGLDWPDVFQTGNKREVEERCRAASIEFEWKDDNRLRTRQVRPAVRVHPYTGESVWFNHMLFFHRSSLPDSARDSILSSVREEDLPFDSFYGDGSKIEADVLDEIRDAYKQETVTFPWNKGDVLMLDNMLVAHGREAFSGPRKILVAMAEATDHKALEAAAI